MSERRYRADVVIIGGGIAGIACALELLDRGKSVVLLERGGEETLGGLARESFGGIFLVGSREQRLFGIKDSADRALADWLVFGELRPEDRWPRMWAEAYVHRCLQDVGGWLRKRSVRFLPLVNWAERGLFAGGNSAPRFHIVWGAGPSLVSALLGHLREHRQRHKLALHLGHRVLELEQRADCFVGCSGIIEGEEAGFRAEAEAVVIAAGGIAGDLSQVRRYWDRAWGEPPEQLLNGSHPAADGRLHDLVRQHGGEVTHLEQMWNYAAGVRHWRPKHPLHGLSIVPPKSALWVNYQGRRIGPPYLVTAYDTRYLVQAICRQREKYSWQLLNREIARVELAVSGAEFNREIRDKRLLPLLREALRPTPRLVDEFIDNCPDFVTGQSVDELARKMNALTGKEHVDPAVLAEEIRRYDDGITRGDVHNDGQLWRIAKARRYRGDRIRTCAAVRIAEPRHLPLIAIRELIVTRKSLGGIQTDLGSRVLDRRGTPLPGLYAAGEAAGFGGGGMHGRRALEGTFLGSCILTGRVAAQTIAAG